MSRWARALTTVSLRLFRSGAADRSLARWQGATCWLLMVPIILTVFLPLADRARAEAARLTAPIIYLGKRYPRPLPLSLLEKVVADEGVQGARLGIRDDNVIGGFLGQHYELTEIVASEEEDVIPRAKSALAEGDSHMIGGDGRRH
jgi:hypothetical protein